MKTRPAYEPTCPCHTDPMRDHPDYRPFEFFDIDAARRERVYLFHNGVSV